MRSDMSVVRHMHVVHPEATGQVMDAHRIRFHEDEASISSRSDLSAIVDPIRGIRLQMPYVHSRPDHAGPFTSPRARVVGGARNGPGHVTQYASFSHEDFSLTGLALTVGTGQAGSGGFTCRIGRTLHTWSVNPCWSFRLLALAKCKGELYKRGEMSGR